MSKSRTAIFTVGDLIAQLRDVPEDVPIFIWHHSVTGEEHLILEEHTYYNYVVSHDGKLIAHNEAESHPGFGENIILLQTIQKFIIVPKT